MKSFTLRLYKMSQQVLHESFFQIKLQIHQIIILKFFMKKSVELKGRSTLLSRFFFVFFLMFFATSLSKTCWNTLYKQVDI